ncbi:MAG: hypothetical protein ACKVQR_06670, partial [Aquabacterium sp.]
SQQRSGHNEEALASLKTALDEWRAVGVESDGDAAANFAIASAWQADALSALGRADDALRVADAARELATRLLERSPTHMLALRGRALLASTEARIRGETGQRALQLAAADAAAGDWRLLSRVDPGNVITISNLGAAHANASFALYELGRPREAVAKVLEPRALLEAASGRSARWSQQLADRLFWAAIWSAELGQAATAEKLLAGSHQAWTRWLQSLPRDAYLARFGQQVLALDRVEIAVMQGDFAQARQSAKGLREHLLGVEPGQTPEQRAIRSRDLSRLHAALGRMELERGDYGAAEGQARWAAEASAELPLTTREYRTMRASDRALWALALARLGRTEEAAPKAAEALAAMRELDAKAGDGQMHKPPLAAALVASAWVDASRAKPLLDEAQKTLDSMPAEARGLRTSRWVEGLIGEARRMLI